MLKTTQRKKKSHFGWSKLRFNLFLTKKQQQQGNKMTLLFLKNEFLLIWQYGVKMQNFVLVWTFTLFGPGREGEGGGECGIAYGASSLYYHSHFIGKESSITFWMSYHKDTSTSLGFGRISGLPKSLPAIPLPRGANNLTKRWMYALKLWKRLARIATSKVSLLLNIAKKVSGTLLSVVYGHLRSARDYWRIIRLIWRPCLIKLVLWSWLWLIPNPPLVLLYLSMQQFHLPLQSIGSRQIPAR